MSARVNLLPREIAERARARRTSSWAVGGVAAYAALLGVLYIAKLGQVGAAQEDRDEAQAQVAQLQTEVNKLQQFAVLDEQVKARNLLLAGAMGTEISWARVLNDLALTFPASSSMTGMVATAEGADAAGVGATTATDPASTSVAGVSFEGYSVDRFAPGVERVLVKFDEVGSFENAYLTEAQGVERGNTVVTQFTGTFKLNEESFTGRYAEGLPPEVGQ